MWHPKSSKSLSFAAFNPNENRYRHQSYDTKYWPGPANSGIENNGPGRTALIVKDAIGVSAPVQERTDRRHEHGGECAS